MNENFIISALGGIGADTVESFIRLDEKYAAKRKSFLRRTATGIAAAVAVVAVGIAAIVLNSGMTTLPTPGDPSGETIIIHLTAKDAAAFFPAAMGAETNQYQTLTLPQKADSPDIEQYEYLPIYRLSESDITLADCEGFAEKYFSKAAQFCGAVNANYTVYEETYGERTYSRIRVNNPYDLEFQHMDFGFSTSYNHIYLSVFADSRTENRIQINGEPVRVSLKDTEEEILSSIKDIVAYLQEYFGTQYKGVTLQRLQEGVLVYVYDADTLYDPPCKFSAPLCSGYMKLSFYNNAQSDYGAASASDAYLSRISIYESPNSWEDQFEIMGKTKMLTLKEAEALLEKGYVFGGHSCPLCMSEQPEIDFSDYDAVALEYVVEDYFLEEGNRIIPFYAFYKYQGESADGVQYACTYVPAIELEGMDEYFENQKKYHNSHSGWSVVFE